MIKDDVIFLFFLENMHEKPLRLGRIHENQTHFFYVKVYFLIHGFLWIFFLSFRENQVF
jgi:hypothetical protein